MTLEKLLEKRNTTNVPLIIDVDGVSMSMHSIQRSEILPQHFVIQSYINNCNCNDCGACYCACHCGRYL